MALGCKLQPRIDHATVGGDQDLPLQTIGEHLTIMYTAQSTMCLCICCYILYVISVLCLVLMPELRRCQKIEEQERSIGVLAVSKAQKRQSIKVASLAVSRS